MIDLHYWPTPNGHKITLFLEELVDAGHPLEYVIKLVNIDAGDQFKPDYLAISPNNKMPAIVDHAPADGGAPISVFESGAILLYLAEKTGLFLPSDPGSSPGRALRGRTATLEWLFWQVGGLAPMTGQRGHFHVHAPDKIPYAIDRYDREIARLHGVLDKRLADRAFLAGDDYSIADMATYPWIAAYDALPPDFVAFPNIKRWHGTIAARPAIARAYAWKAKVKPQAGKPLSDEERKHLFGT
ncbi:MAG TPA: glutathione binding-like protein [Pseudoxanthomonas sp.]